jgi:UDP-glucose 4-epimerase
VIIRTPLVYGPGVKGNMLKLMKLIKRGIPLPLGRILNGRSLISVDNLVDVLILAATRKECRGQTYAVSDGEDISTSELICLIAKAMGKKPRLIPFPGKLCSLLTILAPSLKPIADRLTSSLIIDSSRFKARMQWSPPQTISAGIDSMVSDFLRTGKHVC